MATRPLAPEPHLTEAAWRELDDVIDGIARLARSEESSARFYPLLLERIASALAASGRRNLDAERGRPASAGMSRQSARALVVR